MPTAPRQTATRKPKSKNVEPWSEKERVFLDGLRTPYEVQAFLDSIPYSTDTSYRAPLRVLHDHRAHCFDGALFAAAALRRQGYPPLLLDLRAVNDDDHVLCVFKKGGAYGAVAKSNFVGLRFREPIYKTVRELALSYFESYFNLAREKTLRSFSTVINVSEFDAQGWLTDDEVMNAIAARLDEARHTALLTPAMIKELRPVDDRTYEANTIGTDFAGAHQPGRKANGR